MKQAVVEVPVLRYGNVVWGSVTATEVEPGTSEVLYKGRPWSELRDNLRSDMQRGYLPAAPFRIEVNFEADVDLSLSHHELSMAASVALGMLRSEAPVSGRIAGIGHCHNGRSWSPRGVLILARAAADRCALVVIPARDREEASLGLSGTSGRVVGIDTIDSLFECGLDPQTAQPRKPFPKPTHSAVFDLPGSEFADIRGALELAAAGGHNVCALVETDQLDRVSKALSALLPLPTEAEALDIAGVASWAGRATLMVERPFHEPHYDVAAKAVADQADFPGWLSMSKHGVLALKQLSIFSLSAWGEVRTSRPPETQIFGLDTPSLCDQPACEHDACHIHRRVLSERSDLFDLVAHQRQVLTPSAPAPPLAIIQGRVERARQRQMQRQGCLNGHLTEADVLDMTPIALRDVARSWVQPDRVAHVLRVAWTFADLAGAELCHLHISDALRLSGYPSTPVLSLPCGDETSDPAAFHSRWAEALAPLEAKLGWSLREIRRTAIHFSDRNGETASLTYQQAADLIR